MLVEYPCAMQRKNTYRGREGNVFKCAVAVVIVLQICIYVVTTAPVSYDTSAPQSSEISEYFSDISGCYYNFQHYEEGDRIVTNEPCLNCTCHNRMLMCYLRVCPFTKAIGQDCTIEKKPDQCCPIITCPEVPVKLLTSSTTSSPTPTTPTTEIGFHDNYGCSIHNSFYADGAQVPSDPRKPCELCYCIRNRTACVMQECTLHVEGCKPVYQDGVCCPVRYDCDYEKELTSTSRTQTSDGTVVKSTTYSSVVDCQFGKQSYADGELITTDKPCEHCYCMRGDIVCAVQDCGEPLRGKDCVPTMPPPELCCPSSYDCTNDTSTTEGVTKVLEPLSTDLSPQFSTFEPSSLPARTTTVLSQEQIYEKIGEFTLSSKLTSAPASYSSTSLSQAQEITTAHPSEHIPFDNQVIDASEHSSPTAPPSVTEWFTTIVEEIQTTEYATEKSSSYKPNLFSAVPDTNIVSEQITTESPTIYSSAKTTETPALALIADDESSFDQSSHKEELTTSVPVYETTKSPTETTKFESNEIVDKVNETVVHEIPTVIGSDDENTETTAYPPSFEGRPATERDQFVTTEPSSSSEANRYTFTIREFDRSTTAMKEEEMITKYVEHASTSVRLSQGSSPLPNEGGTEINTVFERTTQSVDTKETSTDLSSPVDADKGTSTEEVVTAISGVPGEGSCLVDGITYSNTSVIESSNPCHHKCVCLSSIPICTLVSCQPPPSDPKCMPVQIKPESCCPVYICNSEEHEQAPQTQIPSHNQIVLDHPEDHPEVQDGHEHGDVDNQTTEETPQASPVTSASSESVAFEEQSNKGAEVPSSSSPSASSSSLSQVEKDTMPPDDSTEVSELTTDALVTVSQTDKPIVVFNNENTAVNEDEYQKITTEAAATETTIYAAKYNFSQSEMSSRLPPIVVTDLPETSTELPLSPEDEKLSTTEKPTTATLHPAVNYVTLSTVADENAEEGDETTIRGPVDGDELPSSSVEYNQQNNKVTNTAEPITPTKIVAEVVTEDTVTEQTAVTSESVVWNEHETQANTIMHDNDFHTIYPSSSSIPEHVETTSVAGVISSSYSNFGSTEEPSASSSDAEEARPATTLPSAESPSTKKEDGVETYITTNKPDESETMTTLHNEEHKTTLAGNDVYGVQSSTLLETPSTETSNAPLVTSTTASETTVLPYEDTSGPTLKLTTHEVVSTDASTEKLSEPMVTTILAEISSEFITVTESTYTKEVQYSPPSTIIGSSSTTEYEETKTTFLPMSSEAENVSEASTTVAPVSDEVPTTKTPETNEIASEEGFTAASPSETTSVPVYINATEKQATPSTSEASPIYSPIQHSTWTPKPVDSSYNNSSSSDAITSSEANFNAQSSTYLTSGLDSNGVVSGPDNTSMEEYDEEPNAFGSGTCRYNGKLYVSAQQIPRDDPCDFCFCFRSDIICLQQSCPPPIHGCRQEPIQGFCCPRYECPVARDIASNATVYTTTSRPTNPTTSMYTARPARVPHDSYRGSARKTGCVINGYFYNVGDDIAIASGPCLECICGSDGRMKCDPKSCSPEPYVRQMMAESSYRRR